MHILKINTTGMYIYTCTQTLYQFPRLSKKQNSRYQDKIGIFDSKFLFCKESFLSCWMCLTLILKWRPWRYRKASEQKPSCGRAWDRGHSGWQECLGRQRTEAVDRGETKAPLWKIRAILIWTTKEFSVVSVHKAADQSPWQCTQIWGALIARNIGIRRCRTLEINSPALHGLTMP